MQSTSVGERNRQTTIVVDSCSLHHKTKFQ
jgi:hypothetical protein